MITLSPRLGEALMKLAQTPDLEAALWKVLSEYAELKIKSLKEEIERFERKWKMSFDEFSKRCEEGTIEADVYSWEVESDFWEWEKAVTLLSHYEKVKL